MTSVTTKIRPRKKFPLFDIINGTILLIVSLICVYPFLYVLFTAISDGAPLSRGEVGFLPKGVQFLSFSYIFNNPRFNVVQGLLNSFLYTLLGTAVSLIITYVTAFVLSRKRFVHRNWIMRLFIITWVFDAGIIPQYIIYNMFGYVDNWLVMIIPGAINTQFLIIARTFMLGIPDDLEEAAFIDGANDWQIMVQVYLPLSITILATVGTFYAVSIWNQYLIPQIYLKSTNLFTIQQVLKKVVLTTGTSDTTFTNVTVGNVTLNQYNLKAASIFITMLPIICVYPFVQRYFKKGILIGSVKG